MTFTVWNSGDRVTSEIINLSVSDIDSNIEKYCAVAEEYKLQHNGSVLLDVSDASLVADLGKVEVSDKYLSESSETRKRIRYTYEWCKKAEHIKYPSADSYVDVSEADGISALAACILDMIRKENKLEVLTDMMSFSLYYIQKVGN